MNISAKGIKTVRWPDSGNDLGLHLSSNDETQLFLETNDYGNGAETWIVEYKNCKEIARHNPRYVETIVWE